MCECPFCTYRGLGTSVPLPVHLTVTLGARAYQAWAWLLDVPARRVWLGTWMNTEGVLQYKTLAGDRRVARAVLKECGVHPGEMVPMIAWTVWTRGVPTPLSNDVTGSVTYVRTPVAHCVCHRTSSAAAVLELPCKRPSQGRVREPKKRKEKVDAAATRVVVAARAAPSPGEEDGELSDEQDEHGEGYDATALGGDAEAVRELLGKRAVWDQEMVDELLRVGARPPLEAHRVQHNGRYRAAQCTVTEPGGRRVHNVWLPMALLHHKYAREVAHLS